MHGPSHSSSPVSQGTELVKRLAAGSILEQEACAIVAAGASLTSFDDYGITALSWAARRKMHKLIDAILTRGVHVDTRDHMHNSTALFHAVMYGNIETVKYLFARGANINEVQEKGETPLHYTTTYNQKEIAKYLIEKGANINVCDNDGQTPLINATFNELNDLVDFLLTAGADINILDNKGMTALMHAVYFDSKDIFNILIKKNPNTSIKNIEGAAVLDIAKAFNRHDMVEKITAYETKKTADAKALKNQFNAGLPSGKDIKRINTRFRKKGPSS